MAREELSKQNDKEALLANVALLYYGEGLTQSEIAQRLGVSRPTVVNMLRDSRDKGIVEIRVDSQVLANSSLSKDIRDKFGLTDVYIARSRYNQKNMPKREEVLAQVARVGAMAMLDIVRSNDLVGVAWGETIKAVSEAMTKSDVENVTVCQIIGSMVSDRVPASEDCAIRIAASLNAKCYTLHAPAVLSSKELANQLVQEPTLKKQLERLNHLDLVVYSVGSTDKDTHVVAAGIAEPNQLQAAVDAGAKGILCCRYVDANGNAMPMAPEDQIVAASFEQLKNTARKLLVVSGKERLEATLALLRGGLATHLCIDDSLALALLEA